MQKYTLKNFLMGFFLIMLSIIFITSVYNNSNIYFTSEVDDKIEVLASGEIDSSTFTYSQQLVNKNAYLSKALKFNFTGVDDIDNVFLSLPINDLEPSKTYIADLSFDLKDDLDNLTTIDIDVIDYAPDLVLEDETIQSNITLFDENGNNNFTAINVLDNTNTYQVEIEFTTNVDGEAYIIFNVPLFLQTDLEFDISNITLKYEEVN